MEELEYTGERIVPDKVNPFLWSEHLARYILAGEFVQDKIVLDIGCGTGYGTNYLAHRGAKKAVGIDKSKESIAYAINYYNLNNVEFKVLDAAFMNFQKEFFDVITAFEIIEHVEDQETILSNVKSILKKNGKFFISTPNKNANPVGYVNPFHKKEMNYNEFHQLLKNHFKHVEILWQNYFFGVGFTKSVTDTITIDNSLLINREPLQYMFGICSDKKISLEDRFLPIFSNQNDYLVSLTNVQKNHLQIIRECIENKKYEQVLVYSKKYPKEMSSDPEWNYLIGFSLSALKRYDEAIKHYNFALENGFSEFWIKYNRGCLYREIGNIPAAISDLERALSLNPDHSDTRTILSEIKKTDMKQGNSRWWRDYVGGLWEEIGNLQFDYLVKNGLKPQSYLLDVGCGSLRGGIHFIKYLQNNHYFGIDKNKDILESGKLELKENHLESKNPTLIQMENFDFKSLGQQFDYALAQSLFTHLPPNAIKICLINIQEVLVKGGRFYATFFENPELNSTTSIDHPRKDGPDITSYPDRDPFHYNFKFFENMCKDTTLKVDYIGDWNHPRNQKIMVFTKS